MRHSSDLRSMALALFIGLVEDFKRRRSYIQ